MSNQQEKVAFSKRLNKALLDCKHPISPTYLANEFNNRYHGQSISIQSANNWLQGKAIPSQDKLSILALWLNVSNQWLRFGDSEMSNSTSYTAAADDIDYLLKFKKLSAQQKKIILSIIDEFIS
ncbi:transcriptional regulator [Acinetobacter larvae]|uniref:Transcriptional regulator n=1 Tax=Acinetobacter larvae TaxID=1789224 RepID=A0A1B2M3V9_9GAMM|nr:transcriptional regulator [Acinetobacter larvae]AOA59890.1 hypothetical protein BFG52_05630 [Acinetobacter larvae]